MSLEFHLDFCETFLAIIFFTGVNCLSWSPQTTFAFRPRLLKLAAGTEDGKVCIITTDLKEDNSKVVSNLCFIV